jgi:hypothetical protein
MHGINRNAPDGQPAHPCSAATLLFLQATFTAALRCWRLTLVIVIVVNIVVVTMG